MSIENRRASQLPAISPSELASNDLWVVADVSAATTKKMTSEDVQTYILSGSLATVASSSHSGFSVSSSRSEVSQNSILSTTSVSSSYASASLSSSYALSASYSPSSGGGATLNTGSLYPVTASWAITASNVATATQALFLVYNNNNNGTASYSITASNARTASYLNIGGSTNVTSSWANNALNSNTSSFLLYTGVANGTASRAVTADSAVTSTSANSLTDRFMIYNPMVDDVTPHSSVSCSFISTMSIDPTSEITVRTLIKSYGNAIVQFTGSQALSSYVYMGIRDTVTPANDYELDRSYLYVDIGDGTIINSGSINIPFSLNGSGSFSGSFMVYVSASVGTQKIKLDINRAPWFDIYSYSDVITFVD